MAAVAPVLSVTVTTTVNGPAVLLAGVPEMVPVEAPMVSPLGNPAADQVYTPLPPWAVTVVAVYADPAAAAGSVAGPVIDKLAFTVRL
jgi:hypothetical protein